MTQRFRRKAGQVSQMTWSTNIRWMVTLWVDNRANIYSMDAVCTYGSGDLATHGHAAEQVGPFDDVDTVLERLLVDAAVNCHGQLTFFE